MKIIRWLLSHTFLILVIISVIYGYMFWGNLLGEDTPAGKAVAYLSSEFVEVEEFVAAVKAKQAELSQNDSSDSAKTEEQMSQPETTVKVVDTAATDTNKATDNRSIDQQPVSISYNHNQARITQDSDGAVQRKSLAAKPISKPVTPELAAAARAGEHPALLEKQKAMASESQVNENQSKEKFVPVEVAQQLNNVDDNGKVINEAQKSEALITDWIVARKSFYQRKYELSEQSYHKVIANTEDNFDAYGELGNVYFNQGKNKMAASAYYEAAAILVKKGQLRRAGSLVGLLQRLDKVKAAELQKLLEMPIS